MGLGTAYAFPVIPFQQHEWNDARRVPLVHVVSTTRTRVHYGSETHVVAVDERPQPFALLGRGHPGSGREFSSAYLDAHAGMGLEIQQPGRRMIAPSVGGHHDESFAILQVDESGGSRFPASSPCGRQEQGSASQYPRADESSRVAVDELMELEVGGLERSRGGVAHSSDSPAAVSVPRLGLTTPATVQPG